MNVLFSSVGRRVELVRDKSQAGAGLAFCARVVNVFEERSQMGMRVSGERRFGLLRVGGKYFIQTPPQRIVPPSVRNMPPIPHLDRSR